MAFHAGRCFAHAMGLGGTMRFSGLVTVTLISLCSIGLSGCVPVIAGALIYDNIADNKSQAEFTTSLNQQNIEREKAGLKPLDWCSEAYKAKGTWAKDQKDCAARIKAYEAGDKSALTL